MAPYAHGPMRYTEHRSLTRPERSQRGVHAAVCSFIRPAPPLTTRPSSLPRSVLASPRTFGGDPVPVVMDADRMSRSLIRIAHEIVERNRGVDDLALVGIRERGVPLA